MLFLAGLLRSDHVNTANLWAMDGTGTEIFPCVLSEQRFKFLLRCLRFDNKSDREERKKTDCLALIQEIFEMFVENCRNNHSISEYCTIDENNVTMQMMMMMMMTQKNSNSTFCDKYINNNKFMEQFRARKIYMFMIEY